MASAPKRFGTLVRRAAFLVIAAALAAPLASAATSSIDASYTTVQARAGAAVYAAKCVSCHGANMQGVTAPAIGGTAFRTSAHASGWTVADWQSFVYENMPLNDPQSLAPAEYADVMAYLLARNCYPAGAAPFPKKEDQRLKKFTIAVTPLQHPADALGRCAVR